MEKTDPQLIQEYLGGDGIALEELISRYLKPVYNFVLRLTGNVHDAEDVTQDVFVKVWKHIKKYNPNQNFRTWLFSIAHHTAIDWLRKKKHIVFSEFDTEDGNVLVDTLVDTAPLADELLTRTEDKEFVASLLTQLSPPYREVLLLRYQDEFTFDEIGKILNKPLNTVKSQHRRAILALQAILTNAPK